MFSHIRRQQQLKAKAVVGPAKKQRMFGDYRMDYIKACVHDLTNKNPASCPLCQISVTAVKEFFENEENEKRINRLTSLARRGRLRYSLLDSWAHNQAYYYSEVAVGFVVEVGLSESVVKALVALSDEGEGFDATKFEELYRILQRRKRIKEIGHYTAVYLQSAIRKMCAYRRVRRDVLGRFELIPETRTRGSFLLDLDTNRHWQRFPNIMPNDRPASPSTMGRRLRSEDRKKNQRIQRFREVLEKELKLEGSDLFEREKNRVDNLKQLAVLRDVILSAMVALMKLRDPTFDDELVLSAGNEEKVEEDSSASGSLAAAARLDLKPVWLSLTSPSPAAFQVAFVQAMLTPFDPTVDCPPDVQPGTYSTNAANTSTMSVHSAYASTHGGPTSRARSSIHHDTGVHPHLKTARSGMSTTSDGSGSGGASIGSLDIPHIDYNKALRKLEQRAWDSMCCYTPEEVIRTLLIADYHSALESGVNFARDENNVWVGAMDLSHKPTTLATNTSSSSNKLTAGKSVKASAAEREEEDSDSDVETNPSKSGKARAVSSKSTKLASVKSKALPLMNGPFDGPIAVLPSCLQLRPFVPGRSPYGVFRLFFFDNELVAVTQQSRFVFYSEVLKHRDVISAAIKSYANSVPVQHMVRTYFHKCAPTRANSRVPTANATGRRTPAASQPRTARRRSFENGAMETTASSSLTARPPSRQGGLEQSSVAAPAAIADKTVETVGSSDLTESDISSASAGDLVRRRSHNATTTHFIKYAPRTTGDFIGGVVSIYAPPHSALYGRTESDIGKCATVATLSDETILENHSKYKFLNKIQMWKALAVRAQNNKMKRPRNRLAGLAKDPSTPTTRLGPKDEADDKFAAPSNAISYQAASSNMSYAITIPPPAALIGTEILSKFPEAGLIYGNITAQQVALAAYEQSGLVGAMASTIRPYRERLQFLTNSVVTSMHQRTQVGVESSEVNLGPSPPPKPLDLLVVDVYVDLRKKGKATTSEVEELESSRIGTAERTSRSGEASRVGSHDEPPGSARGTGHAAAAASTASTVAAARQSTMSEAGGNATGRGSFDGAPTAARTNRGSFDGTPNNPNATTRSSASYNYIPGSTHRRAPAPFKPSIETWQVVGMFSTDSSRPPTSVDLGLFDWEYFQQLKQLHESNRFTDWQKPLDPKQAMRLAHSKERMWTRVDENSGMCTHKPSTATDRDFQMRILGAAPTKAYLEAHLSTKVKKWLGLC